MQVSGTTERGGPEGQDTYLDAADVALAHLSARCPMVTWAVTSTDGQDWHLLRVRGDPGLGLVEGSVLPWSDSVCERMVRTQGPRLVPSLAAVPLYLEAPIAVRLRLASYAGVTLRAPDGEVRGTLCGIGAAALGPPPAGLETEMALCARMLDLVFQAEVDRERAFRVAGEARSRAHADPLTGLGNRARWLAALLEQPPLTPQRQLAVVSVDVDGLKAVNDRHGHAAGDRLLQSVAVALREEHPDALAVARVGGDEFVLLLVADAEGLPALVDGLRASLRRRGLPAAAGAAAWDLERSAADAWAAADREMYDDKQRRREAGLSRPRADPPDPR